MNGNGKTDVQSHIVKLQQLLDFLFPLMASSSNPLSKQTGFVYQYPHSTETVSQWLKKPIRDPKLLTIVMGNDIDTLSPLPLIAAIGIVFYNGDALGLNEEESMAHLRNVYGQASWHIGGTVCTLSDIIEHVPLTGIVRQRIRTLAEESRTMYPDKEGTVIIPWEIFLDCLFLPFGRVNRRSATASSDDLTSNGSLS